PARFNRKVSMSAGMAITAAAGPASNFVLATVALLVFALAARHQPNFDESAALPFLLMRMFEINVALGVFNLLPIPPLDGSRIVDHFMPYRLRDSWASVSRFAPIAL